MAPPSKVSFLLARPDRCDRPLPTYGADADSLGHFANAFDDVLSRDSHKTGVAHGFSRGQIGIASQCCRIRAGRNCGAIVISQDGGFNLHIKENCGQSPVRSDQSHVCGELT